MRPSPIRCAPLAVLVAVLVAAGCGGTSGLGASDASSSPASSSTAELEALYRARKDSARMGFTEADVRFMTGMIGHHAQALVMSALAPTHGASPEVQTLAARIMNAQRDEIASMQRWLRDRGQPVPEVHIDGLKLMLHTEGGQGMDHGGMDHGGMDHGGMNHMDMPGMLTQAQIEELDAARGAAFDRLFLEYMIQHHGGAVVMVDDLFGTDGAAQDVTVFKLASDVQVDQRTEIARMQRMLDALRADVPGGDQAP